MQVDADENRFRIGTFDMDPAAERFFGDDDDEFRTDVPGSAWGDLRIAFAKEFSGDDEDATRKLRDLYEKHGVTHADGRRA